VSQENQMKIVGFIWLEKIVDKLKWKHNLTTDEVEEIFQDKPKFLKKEKGKVEGEDLFNAIGQTESGRYLTVFFIYKSNQQALIITARDMNIKERRHYGKNKR
jgi:uncharacterized DUF497 family protein